MDGYVDSAAVRSGAGVHDKDGEMRKHCVNNITGGIVLQIKAPQWLPSVHE